MTAKSEWIYIIGKARICTKQIRALFIYFYSLIPGMDIYNLLE